MTRQNRKIQFIILFVLVCLVGTISIAYAVLSTTLNINGTAQVMDASWNVHFSNVQVNPYSVSINPTITDNDKITFSADLTTPGQFYKFTVDIVNSGSIDAMIESVIKNPELTTDQKKYLRYEVEYIDGASINETQLLKSGETKTISVLVSYRNDIPTSYLPTTETDLDLEIRLVYVQANSLGTDVLDNSGKYNVTYVGVDEPEYIIQSDTSDDLVIKFQDSFNDIKIKSGENYLEESLYSFTGDSLTIYDAPTNLVIINVDAIQIIPDFVWSKEEYMITMGGYSVYRVNDNSPGHNNLWLNGTYDITNMKYVEFDFYVPSGYDPNLLGSMEHEFELTSSGRSDVSEFRCSGLHLWYNKLIPGQWNHVIFNFSDFTGSTDKTKINYIGMYWNSSSGDNTYNIPGCKIKNFKFSNYIL